eukprot:6186662-Pleurochrysis_carterae.AAC.6
MLLCLDVTSQVFLTRAVSTCIIVWHAEVPYTNEHALPSGLSSILARFAQSSESPEVAEMEARGLLALAHHLKEGRGLAIVASIVPRDTAPNAPSRLEQRAEAKSKLNWLCDNTNLTAFTDVVVSNEFETAMGVLVDTVGIGALRPNTIALSVSLPVGGARADELGIALRHARLGDKAVLLLCVSDGARLEWIDKLRDEYGKLNQGYIDVWWWAHDGALPLMIAHLLQMHASFHNSSVRIFMYLPEDRDSFREAVDKATIEAKLRNLLSMLRIATSHVEVVMTPPQSSFDEMEKAKTLNATISARVVPFKTHLVVTNLPPPRSSSRGSTEPRAFAQLLEHFCALLPPLLFVSGGESPISFDHGVSQVTSKSSI